MRYFSFVLGLMLLVGCARNPLQPGDLLFQVGEGGMPMAIEDVWESVPEEGVRNVPLQQFLDESALDSDGKPYVRVYRVACKWEDVLLHLKALKGRPYDQTFRPGNEALYCSELVYECYRDSTGAPLFTTIPMTFKGADGAMVPYWVSHYAALGVAIPEGEPGTNPNDLSRSPLLTPVPVEW